MLFADKNLSELDCTIKEKSIFPPTPKKILVQIPFSNEVYDFSTVGTGGEVLYENRKIEVVVNLHAYSKQMLHSRYSNILNCLLTSEKSKLIFDDDKNYYYNASISSISELEENLCYGEFKVVFIAEPYKYLIKEIGKWTWDDFNFELDKAEDNNSKKKVMF